MHRKDTLEFPIDQFDMWEKFIRELRHGNRFALSERSEVFLEAIMNVLDEQKSISVKKGDRLYRSRIVERGIKGNRKDFALSELGAPPEELTSNGRLNPIGIPYLYLASTMETSISEIRPWMNCNITVAEFQMVKECRIANFCINHLDGNLPVINSKFSNATWNLVASTFSYPFDPRDSLAYLPTQYLAERVKQSGFDGLAYDSSLGSGYNIALFDNKMADAVTREKAIVTKMNIEFSTKKIDESER